MQVRLALHRRAHSAVRRISNLEQTAMANHHDRTNPPDDMSAFETKLMEAFRKLEADKERARSLGMFVEERDLLICKGCGLGEDVLNNGLLVVRQSGDYKAPDSGLRFQEIRANVFKCPRCAQEVSIDEEGNLIE
jgi:hypothetical protein